MKKKKILSVLITASMLASCTACSKTQEESKETPSNIEKTEKLAEQTEVKENSNTEEESVNITDKNQTETKPTNNTQQKPKVKTPDKNKPDTSQPSNEEPENIRPEFKEALDSYEAYIDEYCSFMKKYADSNNDTSMLLEYSQMMIKYAEFAEKIEALKNEEMNDTEANYYMKITLKVSQKLLEISQ